MTNQLTIRGTELGTYLAGYHEALERARERVLHPFSKNTERSYKTAWAQWEEHCRYVGHPAYPIDPVELVAYLEHRRSLGAAPNTVRQHLAALCSLDKSFRQAEDPKAVTLRQNAIVWRWLRSWGRENPTAPQKRAPPLSAAQLREILEAARDPGPRAAGSRRRRRRANALTHEQQARGTHAHAARYCRDRAMILLGVGAALRISELVALNVADVARMDRGLLVRIRSSKTDQAGKGVEIDVFPCGNSLLCPIDAWCAWLAYRGEGAGPAFLEIDRQGLFGDRITERGAEYAIQARARRVGLSLVSAHSLRVSMATQAGKKRKSNGQIMHHGRWKSPAVFLDYMRQAELFDETTNPTAGLWDDD